MDRIAIFKTGHHAATSGETLDATADYVRAIAAAYDPALHEAPIVIGHPKDNAPAFGWVRALTFDEGSGTLYADLAQVEPQFAALLAAGRFKKRSASIYDPGHPRQAVSAPCRFLGRAAAGSQRPGRFCRRRRARVRIRRSRRNTPTPYGDAHE